MNSKRVALCVAALACAMPAAAAEQLTGGSFDGQAVASISGMISGAGFVYPGSTVVGGWGFLTNSGIIDGVAGTPWFGATPPQGFQGPQYAFVQGTGALEQFFTATQSGVLKVSWLEGSRPLVGGSTGLQNYDLLLFGNGSFLGDFGNFNTGNGQNFVARSQTLLPVQAGTNYRLVFRGRATSDSTVFIDSVSATIGVPEPASWLMLTTGFGLAGLIARRRRNPVVAA